MQPQGSSIINSNYFSNITQQTTNLINQINYFRSNGFSPSVISNLEQQLQEQLQTLANQIVPDILTQINAVNSQAGKLSPALGLVTAPVTSLPQVIAFITSFQSEVLALQLTAPYTNLVSQAAQLAIELASLTSAINSASQQISPAAPVQIPGSPSVRQGQSVGAVMEVTRA